MRIAVIGAAGQVGSDLVEVLQEAQEHVIAFTRTDLDICDGALLREKLRVSQPDIIVNCAVYHPVDECEVHPEMSFTVNAIAVRELGLVARDIGAKVAHLSSDYVFSGELGRPYREDDIPDPISVFGVSKVAGEQLLRAVLPAHFIIRTSGLYGLSGSRVKRGNFVDTMLRLGQKNGQVKVVDDLRMAQTSTRDVARQILTLVRTEHYGTYHACDHGDYSWCEFARKIFEYAEMEVRITPVSWKEMPAVAPRPRCSVLENHRLKETGLDQMQPIDVALKEYLKAKLAVAASAS